MSSTFDPNSPISDLIAHHALARPDADALVFEGERLSWGEFDQQVNRVANGIREAGIQRRENVAILSDNLPAYFVTLFGILRAGACAVPLSAMVDDTALRAMLDDSGARLLFASQRHIALADRARNGNANLPDERCIAFNAFESGWVDFPRWLAAQSAEPPGIRADEEDPFQLIYSSGTTGVPKGILHHHRSRMSYWASRAAYLFSHNARTILSTPLYSNTTQYALLPTVAWGGATLLLRKSDVQTYLRMAQDERATHTMQVPVQYRRLHDFEGFGDYDLSSFLWKFSTSAPLSVELKRWIVAAWPGRLTEVYGMTEGGVGCALHAHESPHKLHTIGKPIPGMELRIVDQHMRDVPRGEAGELIGRSPYMMVGYYNKPDETARSRWVDEHGQVWQRSGDVGRMDEDGYVVLLDRIKDMIISGGFNIYSADLEAVLATHPQVRDCGVIGVPSEAWGETPIALVVTTPGADITEAALLEWANARLGKLQRLSAIEFRDALPRSPIGKLLKRELREPYWRETGRKIG